MQTAAQYRKRSDHGQRKTLELMRYQVTQREGAEPAFDNEYRGNEKQGIYVDIVCLRRTAFQFAGQVQFGYRLADFHEAPGT